MYRATILLTTVFFFNLVSDIVASPINNTLNDDSSFVQCKEILKRKEWRTLDDREKKDYIDAVKCLQAKPINDTTIPAAKSKFDLFQGSHMNIATKVHYVGQFLIWHRHFLKMYEENLRKDCGYKGAQPYWNWSEDADNESLLESPIFHATTGFGGNGVPGTYTPPSDPSVLSAGRINPAAFFGCVQDGPFANYTLHLGPGHSVTDHCLTRGINESTHKYLNSTAVNSTMAYDNFQDFHQRLEGNPSLDDHRQHDGGHIAVGGEMSNFFSSPGDPLFYMHHGRLDQLWWTWQQQDAKRLNEVAGRTTIDQEYVGITPDYILEMNPMLGPSVQVRDVMVTESAPNCYTYI